MPEPMKYGEKFERGELEVEPRSINRDADNKVAPPHEVQEKSAEEAPGLPPSVDEHALSDDEEEDEDEENIRPQRAQSRTSSTRSRVLNIIPRAHRRGLFAQLAFLPEVDRPYDYSNKVKWTITLFVAIAAAAAPMGSAIFYRGFSSYIPASDCSLLTAARSCSS